MEESDLKFTLTYAISLIVVIFVCVILLKSIPSLHPVLVILVGLITAYLFVIMIRYVMPTFETTASNMSQYVEYSIYSNLNDLGYFNIWPPVFVVLLIFIILLYNGQIRSGYNNMRRNM